MEKSPRPLLKEEEGNLAGQKGGGFSVKKLLLVDALPLAILSVIVVIFVCAGGAIMQKLEDDNYDQPFHEFGTSVEYCMTLLTTIGYGHLTPVTQAGRLATVFYGAIGIPLFFALLFKIGAIFAKITSGLLALLGLKNSVYTTTTRHQLDVNCFSGNFLAMALSILIFLAYLVGTTFLIRDVMDWEADGRDLTFIDAFYFNFITLSTTGFGDMYPALDGLFFAYLIAGLSLVFMNIIMVKNFIDHILLILQRELRLI